MPKGGPLTGKELLHALQAMDVSELNYTVLIGNENWGWGKLVSIKKDFEMKSIDLEGEK